MIKKTTFISLALAAIVSMFGCGEQKPTLHFYTWSDYISEENVEEFETTYNCKIKIDTFDSNETMYSKIKRGATGYDVILPTSYMAKIMNDEGLLETLDHSKMENLANIEPLFLENFFADKKMEYSVPFLVGVTCIAYDKSKIKDIEKSWAVFGDPKYKGKMTMLDDVPETMGAALKYLGYPLNSTNPKEVESAKNLLMQWKNNLAKFDNEFYKTGLAQGEFLIAQGYSGDILQVVEENSNIDLFIPKEGSSMSSDDFVILKDAKNKDLAYAFINFMYTKERAAKNMEETYFYAPVVGAAELLEKELHDLIYISPETYETCEAIQDLGDDRKMYNDAWEKHIKM